MSVVRSHVAKLKHLLLSKQVLLLGFGELDGLRLE